MLAKRLEILDLAFDVPLLDVVEDLVLLRLILFAPRSQDYWRHSILKCCCYCFRCCWNCCQAHVVVLIIIVVVAILALAPVACLSV